MNPAIPIRVTILRRKNSRDESPACRLLDAELLRTPSVLNWQHVFAVFGADVNMSPPQCGAHVLGPWSEIWIVEKPNEIYSQVLLSPLVRPQPVADV